MDPSLVSGFAAEARSHLPQIHTALEQAAGSPEAIDDAKRRFESMRDASSMVGLEPLGRALDLIVRRLEDRDTGALAHSLQLLDGYLGDLVESPRSSVEPQDLLDALAADGAETSGAAPTSGGLEAADEAEAPEGEVAVDVSSAPPKGQEPPPLPMPSWVTRGEASSSPLPLPPSLGGFKPSSENEVTPPPDMLAPGAPSGLRTSTTNSAPKAATWGAALSTSTSSTRVSPPADIQADDAKAKDANAERARADDSAPPPTLQAPASPRRSSPKKKSAGPSDAIREIFAAESDEHAQAISKLLAKLQPHQFLREVISNLRRRVHNLKGSAALVKLDDLSQVAHGMEDLLDVFYEQSRGPSRQELSALELAGDALQALIYDRDLSVELPTVMAALADASAEDDADVDGLDAPGTARVDGGEPEAARPLGDGAVAEGPAETPAEASSPRFAEAAEVGEARSGPEPLEERKRYVRVSVEALDQAMQLLVEVDAERHLLRDLIAQQKDHSLELDLADRRLHREVRALESDLEVAALGGAGLKRSQVDPETPFDALELDRYSELHERSRSLIESAGDLAAVQSDLGGQLVSMDHSIERLEGTAVRLRDRLLGLRLVPFSSLAPRLEGVVRLAARSARKEARLEVDDGGVELDRDVLDALMDPLDHLLRNAVAHGIESPDARAVAGKPEAGVIRLEARYGLDGVELVLSDDGAGIDVDAVSRRAIERGIRSEGEVRGLQEEAVRELIFEPGLSTAASVDQLAGRGVGMDVVRQRLQELRGRLVIA
ncbi:MAG: Hpt domain-containing protein, partial [Acidobacteriota bacterium]